MAPLTPSSALLFGAALGSTAGIEAAVSCSLAGLGVLCEKGDIIGHAVRDWGHVRLFSSNSLNCSPAGLRALADLRLAPPDPATYPTGDELCETYLEPLAKWLAQREDCEETLVEGLAGVIDASGTYGRGNFLGRGGAPALGERKPRLLPACLGSGGRVCGAKSYGRASSFLLAIGHKQVQGVVALLAEALLP
ncbi:hypothetical protein EMIHUDRAFT_209086 [Emiliania huxleyi CCMP1516]|uniref:Uncharacterized protein n=2 Tax=Emiliania huxleyi TaxID=2903 RepID=A0A0D3J7N0_EMIH1|nr:hypothetical protein EMIHUDRAFT_209086 [Emiliania huxleyi CCMP1516]EOD19515.1 hypothetical protein EMIHUDRAFT_209086 [Emiliania huxleyi CCMP1516]|eukprot:XP_005771944.1 hypothetical protein EMIHUDRAFT_209086 [Emiliania huxleyi CCMP1516]